MKFETRTRDPVLGLNNEYKIDLINTVKGGGNLEIFVMDVSHRAGELQNTNNL